MKKTTRPSRGKTQRSPAPRRADLHLRMILGYLNGAGWDDDGPSAYATDNAVAIEHVAKHAESDSTGWIEEFMDAAAASKNDHLKAQAALLRELRKQNDGST